MHDDLKASVSADMPRLKELLATLIRMESVSAVGYDPAAVRTAAESIVDMLDAAGFTGARLLESADGHPGIFAERAGPEGAPTVLLYAHYDVQPPGPAEEWETGPFDPMERNGRLYGRGASDDKGGVLVAIRAVEALAAAGGKPPLNITFLIEGEEEIGSPNLTAFMEQHRDLLAADLAISADGGIFGVGVPSVTVGSRGLAGAELRVKGAAADLHSGSFGGAVANPIMALSRILASMQDEQGRVLVDGFHDGVTDLDPAVRKALDATPVDDAAELSALALADWWGDPLYTPLERRTVRPTLEINGVTGGFQGRGIKTVLPSEASAKITCRLVGSQDPTKVFEALAAHVRKVTPPGVTATLMRLPGRAKPYQMPVDHPVLELANASLRSVFGKEPFFEWSGGTVPVAETFHSMLGIWCLYFAFGEPDNQLHAPNEFVRMGTMRQGTEATVRLLLALADDPAALRG